MNDDLFSYAAERASRDQAMALVESNNNPNPNELAFQEMVGVLRGLPHGAEVTSDSLLVDLAKYAFTDNRAVGPLMARLRKTGFIKPTIQMRPSLRPGNHLAPRRVYLNLVGSGSNLDTPPAPVILPPSPNTPIESGRSQTMP